jgi:protoporphyrinogen oxidase
LEPTLKVQRMDKNIAVIGGGLMGMSIALKLSEMGFNVTIIESEEKVGGLASVWQIGDYVWDKFYHVILPDDAFTLDLLKKVSLENEINWVETKTGFFIDKNYYSMSSTVEFLRFPALNLFDKFRLGLTILAGSYQKNYNKLEKLSVVDWLIKWSGKKTFNKIWLPLLKAKLGDGYKRTSAAFICATMKRLYGARKKGSKKEVFGYVKGGYSTILNALELKIKSLGINVITNTQIAKVEPSNDGMIDLHTAKDEKMTFDCAISTLPSFLTSKIAGTLSVNEKNVLEKINYLGVVCVSMILKKPLTPYYVTNITDEKIPLTGVIEMTALVDKSNFGGNSLIYLPKYTNSFDPIFDLSDREIMRNFIENLKIMQPDLADEDIITSRVSKARFVITLPELEYSKKLPDYKTSIPNFFIINSSFITDGTLNVNETLKVSHTYLPKVLNNIEQ